MRERSEKQEKAEKGRKRARETYEGGKESENKYGKKSLKIMWEYGPFNHEI